MFKIFLIKPIEAISILGIIAGFILALFFLGLSIRIRLDRSFHQNKKFQDGFKVALVASGILVLISLSATIIVYIF